MRLLGSATLLVVGWLVSSTAASQVVSEQSSPKRGDLSHVTTSVAKVPTGVILVKGAWSGASDSITPVPEAGSVFHGVFSDPYFSITYALPEGWSEKYKGPPPSDGGRYVLAELTPANTFTGPDRGSILITAQDMFFTPVPASNAAELIQQMKNNLQADYEVERLPMQTNIAGHSFTLFAYWSPVAQLHWYVLATDVRCHTLQFTFTSRDTKLLESLLTDMNQVKLFPEADPAGGAGGSEIPVCIPDYARDQNLITRVNPVFAERRFNPVPVRIIINKEGKVRHIHFLSAFPDQMKAITDALSQWKFKPRRRDGHPVEVETGILFGRARDRELRPAVR